LREKREVGFAAIDPGVPKTVVAAPGGKAIFISSKASGLRRIALRPNDFGAVEFGQAEMLDATPGVLITGASADGRVLALVSDENGLIRILHPGGNAVEIHDQPGVWQAVVSPDGRFVATAYFSNHHPEKENAKAWDATTGKLLAEFPTGPAGSVSFAQDGAWVEAGGAGKCGLWRTSDWKLATPLDNAVNAVFSTSSRAPWLAAVTDPDVSVFRLADGERLARLKCPENPNLRLFANGSRLAMTSPDTTTYVYDLNVLHRELARIGLDW
jgi:WD40 repeat protein